MAYEASDHYNGKTFFNPWGANNHKSLWEVLKWKWTTDAKPWEEVSNAAVAPVPAAPETGVVLSWVNHSTFLLRSKELNILTDPVWSDRTSPVSFAGPKRVRPAGHRLIELPHIDVVIVSHNHYDHLDIETLKLLETQHQPLFLVPLGDGEWMKKAGLKNVLEMDWWKTHEFKGARFTFLPAQHWSARGMFDRNHSLWGSWGIELAGLKIYHAGDTGLGPHFAEISHRWAAPDVAMLPIGAYEPRWFMKMMHMNPEDAVEAFKLLGAKRAVGMHFGTFQLTDEEIERPIKDLAIALEKSGIAADKFTVPQVGAPLSFQ
jgi:L-ascorbate metabolism protein UlaG (beta-lactamase superfamily)